MFGFRSRNPISTQLTTTVGTHFNEHELRKIDRLGTVVELQAGATLTTEGRPGRETMLILSGSAEVSRNGVPFATVSTGDIVGEQAVLTGAPRNATLVATTDVRVVVFNPREFTFLLAECPRLEQQMIELQESRLVSA